MADGFLLVAGRRQVGRQQHARPSTIASDAAIQPVVRPRDDDGNEG
jgi:hypothetical protein